jgi:tRNA-dihydrouridine synthase B
VVSMPEIVNGDIRSAEDCKRALDQTGCAGVMIGRRAIEHPWIFREARARLDHKGKLPAPTTEERFALCREQLLAMSEARGERRGVRGMRRYYPDYLRPVSDASHLVRELNAQPTLETTLAVLERAQADVARDALEPRAGAMAALST